MPKVLDVQPGSVVHSLSVLGKHANTLGDRMKYQLRELACTAERLAAERAANDRRREARAAAGDRRSGLFRRFVKDHCERATGATCPGDDLHSRYAEWCRAERLDDDLILSGREFRAAVLGLAGVKEATVLAGLYATKLPGFDGIALLPQYRSVGDDGGARTRVNELTAEQVAEYEKSELARHPIPGQRAAPVGTI